jgi:hypothetical protein
MKLSIPIGDASLTTSKDNALLIILEHYTKSSQAPLEHTAFDDDGNRLHKVAATFAEPRLEYL